MLPAGDVIGRSRKIGDLAGKRSDLHAQKERQRKDRYTRTGSRRHGFDRSLFHAEFVDSGQACKKRLEVSSRSIHKHHEPAHAAAGGGDEPSKLDDIAEPLLAIEQQRALERLAIPLWKFGEPARLAEAAIRALFEGAPSLAIGTAREQRSRQSEPRLMVEAVECYRPPEGRFGADEIAAPEPRGSKGLPEWLVGHCDAGCERFELGSRRAEIALDRVGHGERDTCTQMVGLHRQRAAEHGAGAFNVAVASQHLAQVGGGLGESGIELHRPLESGDRITPALHLLVGNAQIVVSEAVVRVELDRALEMLQCIGSPPGVNQRVAEVAVTAGILGDKLDHRFESRDGELNFPTLQRDSARVVECRLVIGMTGEVCGVARFGLRQAAGSVQLEREREFLLRHVAWLAWTRIDMLFQSAPTRMRASSAMRAVVATSSAVCAADTNPASKALGAR